MTELRGYRVCLCLSLGLSAVAHGAITIGPGPWIGTDTAGNSYNEEFQDWTHADCRALDGGGATVGGRFNFGDGFDDSRDLIAFYSRMESGALYLRVDFFDLGLGAESGNVDLYVAIDCAPGGQPWMPNFTDVQVDPAHHWEVCVAVYDAANHDVFRADFAAAGGYLGAHFHSQIDAVEFGLDRQVLLENGWDGSSTVYFTVMTTKDFADIVDHSDATDTFFDDDRGYNDGVINGAIASNAGVGRAKYASIAHGNQSINKADDLRVHIFDPPTVNKTGFIRTLDTHEIFDVPINLHLSGTLIAASAWAEAAPGDDPQTDGPAFLRRVAEFANLDQQDGKPGSLIGGVFAEHIMPFFEGPVNARSIALFNDLMQDQFALSPTDVPVMHTPERVIRSDSTGLAPLDGHTFEDIETSSYIATYVDEVTHLHWWFYPLDPWSGANGTFDAPHHHKIHKINGVYCFAINDREDQAKFGPHDGGMAMDTRFTLLDKAAQTDQAQLTLIFDDWEALAGKSFDPVAGVSNENNNQWQYQQTIRWAANHPWIEMVNLADVLDRAVNPANPQYDGGWVVDQGYGFSLSMQTYEWLKHAAENSYNYWVYNQNAGFTGNEQNFYNLVPVILGEQGDYHRRFAFPVTSDAQAATLDGPTLPSGRPHGDLNTPGTLMYEAWAAVESAPPGALRRLAEAAYVSLIYETAWHEEDYGQTAHYQGTNFGDPWPVPDPTWDGINTWALRLQNHVRSVGVIADAAQWAEDVKQGVRSPITSAAARDLDQDGEAEYVICNNRVYACFERYGGRLVHAFAMDPAADDAVQVIGAPVVNPSEPGEEERLGNAANRCSGFKDMHTDYVDASYAVSLGGDRIHLTAPDGMITKEIVLPDGAGSLYASYTNATGNALHVRVGASPNVADLIPHGRANLASTSTPEVYTLRNLQGGFVRVHLGDTVLVPSPADAGHDNRNLALTEQIEVSGGAAFQFELQLNTSMFDADLDGDVDEADFATLALCVGGPGAPLPGACPADVGLLDWDGDGDVDLADVAPFQRLFTGRR